MLIDGIDINQIDPADLRRNIGYVPQDVVLFKGTVRENIVQKVPYVDDMQIIKAARERRGRVCKCFTHLVLICQYLKEAYGISGGQRQSIAVARHFCLIVLSSCLTSSQIH